MLGSTDGSTKEVRAPGVALSTLAESHLWSCQACTAKWSDLARLHAALDQLRTSTSQMEAPARLEANLLAAFRQSTPRKAAFIGTNLGRLLWASAAAFLLFVSGVTLYMTLKSKPRIVVQRESVRQENKSPGTVLQQQPSPRLPGGQAAVAAPEGGRAGANHRRPPRAADNLVARNQVREKMMQQVRVPAGEQLSLNGGSNVIRVNLPFSSLAAVGVPMVPDLPDRQVTADVVVDPFGAIIAIRLVEMKPGEAGLAN